jgi:TonB family protein
MFRPIPIAIGVLSLILLLDASPGFAQDRNPVVERLAKGISAANVHKIYIPDFPDASGHPSGVGAFYAATFSKFLTTKSKGFTVLNRVEAHAFLLKNNLTDYDLADSLNLAKFASQFNVDVVLFGVANSTDSAQLIQFSLRDLTGKELLKDSYGEPAKLTEYYFPAGAAPSGWPYYFYGVDGVSLPSCSYMPNPPYPEEMRKDRISGVISLSALINIQGNVESVRVTKSVDKKLDQLSLATIKTWRCKPATDADGNRVAIRVPFEIAFKLF